MCKFLIQSKKAWVKNIWKVQASFYFTFYKLDKWLSFKILPHAKSLCKMMLHFKAIKWLFLKHLSNVWVKKSVQVNSILDSILLSDASTRLPFFVIPKASNVGNFEFQDTKFQITSRYLKSFFNVDQLIK